jgi:hypothetical protein
MTFVPSTQARIPVTPKSIQKGTPLKHLLGTEAVDCLIHNIFHTQILMQMDFDKLHLLV